MLRSASIALVVLLHGIPTLASVGNPLRVTDGFGRDVTIRGITLVDWDGHLANPLIPLTVHLPGGEAPPVSVILSADDGRLYFEGESTVGLWGPRRVVDPGTAGSLDLRLAIFPDRDGEDETHEFNVRLVASDGSSSLHRIPIHVLDEDAASPPRLRIETEFDEDKSGFLGMTHREVVRSAARDWAYFLDDPGLDPVLPGSESTWLWDYPLAWTGSGGHAVRNRAGYTGFLLYAVGIEGNETRSTGGPSLCCLQTVSGEEVPLRRSGQIAMETRGNYNTRGWSVNADPDHWYVSSNLRDEPNDFYSIVLHEIGHAIAFHGSYPGFRDHSSLESPRVRAYYGGAVPVDDDLPHFVDAVDPASGFGAFGNEYAGSVPRRRWLITKLDLLLAEAMGHTLAPRASLSELTVPDATLSPASLGAVYHAAVPATGGVAVRDWSLVDGALPPGLELDRFTGEVAGVPELEGDFTFTVRVEDVTGTAVTAELALNVGVRTPVRLLSMTGRRSEVGVELEWEVVSDEGPSRFRVLREAAEGPRVLTPEPLWGEDRFRFVDRDAPRTTLTYWLEGSDRTGESTRFGPIEVAAGLSVTALRAAPNPFSGRLRLGYTLAAAGPARIVVLDIQGRRRAVLLDRYQPAGDHVLFWDGQIDGQRAPAGLYWVRFEGSGATVTTKVLSLGR